MPIPVVCPSCATRLRAPDNSIGRQSKCPKCGAAIKVPNADRENAGSANAEPPPRPARSTEPSDDLPPTQDWDSSSDAILPGRQSNVPAYSGAASNFITLSCPSCGGSLKVTHDVDRFACGYCGAEHVVRRGGGIVSLAPILGSLERIEANVARIADSHAGEIRCTKCGSEQVQSLKLIHELGTSEVATVSSGTSTGLAFGATLAGAVFGGKGVLVSKGANRTTTTGSYQTKAARLAAPPKKRNLTGPGILIVIAVFCLVAAAHDKAAWVAGVGIVFIGLGIWASVLLEKWNREEWPRRRDIWLRSFRCLKCGNKFLHPPAP